VLVVQRKNIGDAIRQDGVGEVTYHHWRREFNGYRQTIK
jgi:hypothetical protein